MTRAHRPGSYVVTVTRPLFGGRGAWGSATHYTVPLPGTFATKAEARLFIGCLGKLVGEFRVERAK